jgi:8-oxo-dGTP diphosphatase
VARRGEILGENDDTRWGMLEGIGKHLHVTCAIIERNGFVLAAQRGEAMSMPLKWEFPGGKIRADESPEDCLRREIVEELDVKIAVLHPLQPATHNYPSLTVTLYPFICSIADGILKRNEHAAVIWLPPDRLHTLDWAEADLPVLAAYCRFLKKS